jgi:hypothetical protein
MKLSSAGVAAALVLTGILTPVMTAAPAHAWDKVWEGPFSTLAECRASRDRAENYVIITAGCQRSAGTNWWYQYQRP